jgi:hypothetical protein
MDYAKRKGRAKEGERFGWDDGIKPDNDGI